MCAGVDISVDTRVGVTVSVNMVVWLGVCIRCVSGWVLGMIVYVILVMHCFVYVWL